MISILDRSATCWSSSKVHDPDVIRFSYPANWLLLQIKELAKEMSLEVLHGIAELPVGSGEPIFGRVYELLKNGDYRR